MKLPSGVQLFPEQVGLIHRHKRELYREECEAFYQHYRSCNRCKPHKRCEEGLRLAEDYEIAVSAASILTTLSRAERRQMANSIRAPIRQAVQDRVKAFWDVRLPKDFLAQR